MPYYDNSLMSLELSTKTPQVDSGVYVLHFCTECGRNIMTSHPVWYVDSLREGIGQTG